MGITLKLKSFVRFYKSIWGEDEFNKVAEPWKERIRAGMKAQKEENVLKFVLPIAQKMSKNNDDPSFMLAVASEMCGEVIQ
jgi:hypothetical protein